MNLISGVSFRRNKNKGNVPQGPLPCYNIFCQGHHDRSISPCKLGYLIDIIYWKPKHKINDGKITCRHATQGANEMSSANSKNCFLHTEHARARFYEPSKPIRHPVLENSSNKIRAIGYKSCFYLPGEITL